MSQRRCQLARSSSFFLAAVLQPKLHTLCIALLFSLLLTISYSQNILAARLAVRGQKPAPTLTVTGITEGALLYREVWQSGVGPEQVSLLNVDLTNPDLCLGVVQAHDRLVSADETVSSMAERTGALAGVNGDYFEIHGPGRPISTVIRNGKLWQSPNVYPSVGVTSSGWLMISTLSFAGEVATGRASHALKSVNIYNDGGKGIVLITPALGVPISAKNETVAFLRPIEDEPGGFTVESVQTNVAELPALTGQYALLGGGEAGQWLSSNLDADMEIKITSHIAPDDGLAQAIGGGPWLVRNGALYIDPNPPAPHPPDARNPLTAVAVTQDGTHALFAVFDGRMLGPQKSKGVTNGEAASYMLAHGAYQAMLLDGGGSSTMVARLPDRHQLSVINTPSDGRERPVANGLFLYKAGDNHSPCERRNELHSTQAT